MKIKCEYCESFIDDTDEKCPNCGGVNNHLKRSAQGIPKTIQELKQWCLDKNIPLEQARFFIGEDYRGAKAFGIYQDTTTENFIVYKNKADGSRAIRYEGKDEAYAVNELYMKLKEEILNQKQHQASKSRPLTSSGSSRSSVRSAKSAFRQKLGFFIAVFLIVIVIDVFSAMSSGPRRGYYNYNNDTYYYQPDDGWYLYDNGNWSSTYADNNLTDDYDNYYNSDSYYSQDNVSDFMDSGYYYTNSNESWSSDWDSDSSWDSGSDWDSGSSDWDSDW